MDFTELYCAIDDFIKKISSTEQKKMTGKGKNFKSYFQYLHCHHQNDFPKITSYNRFVELMSQSLLPLCFYFEVFGPHHKFKEFRIF